MIFGAILLDFRLVHKQFAFSNQNKPFVVLAELYAEVCNEFLGPIFSSLRLQATQLLQKKFGAVVSCWQHCTRFDCPEI